MTRTVTINFPDKYKVTVTNVDLSKTGLGLVAIYGEKIEHVLCSASLENFNSTMKNTGATGFKKFFQKLFGLYEWPEYDIPPNSWLHTEPRGIHSFSTRVYWYTESLTKYKIEVPLEWIQINYTDLN